MFNFRNLFEKDKPQDESRIEPEDPFPQDAPPELVAKAEVVIEVEPKDPKVLGDGGQYVRCRTCGRDLHVSAIIDIPVGAACPLCGVQNFTFDISQ